VILDTYHEILGVLLTYHDARSLLIIDTRSLLIDTRCLSDLLAVLQAYIECTQVL
jgi:hypothetical protein